MTTDPSSADNGQVRVGGLIVDRTAATHAARDYLSGRGQYGYPVYDGFDAGGGAWRLTDGDLLAPGLLNVPVRIPAFYSLQSVRPQLEAWLGRTARDARLVDASDADIERLGELFSLLDDGIPGVRGVILAKVMHRKRPSLVPLYDKFVYHCYVGPDDNAPLKRDPKRSWRDFMILLARAMQADLRREAAWFQSLTELAAGPVSITPLRALDIVAWSGGKAHAIATGLNVHGDEDDQ